MDQLAPNPRPRLGPSENGLTVMPPVQSCLRNSYTKRCAFPSPTFLSLFHFLQNLAPSWHIHNLLISNPCSNKQTPRSSTAGTPPDSVKPSRAPSPPPPTRGTSPSSSPSPLAPKSASAPITASPASSPPPSAKSSSSSSSSIPSSGYSSASPPEAAGGGKSLAAHMP